MGRKTKKADIGLNMIITMNGNTIDKNTILLIHINIMSQTYIT
jgi:hypothetical protein